MPDALLDPWDDAATIARRLEEGGRLIIVIGAEEWCTSCRALKPVFQSVANDETNDRDVPLWLDLEEHAEFLGGFVPPSLPFLLVYQRGVLTHGLVVQDLSHTGIAGELSGSRSVEYEDLPDLDRRFRTADWSI